MPNQFVGGRLDKSRNHHRRHQYGGFCGHEFCERRCGTILPAGADAVNGLIAAGAETGDDGAMIGADAPVWQRQDARFRRQPR